VINKRIAEFQIDNIHCFSLIHIISRFSRKTYIGNYEKGEAKIQPSSTGMMPFFKKREMFGS
jgi:hypothetical protein